MFRLIVQPVKQCWSIEMALHSPCWVQAGAGQVRSAIKQEITLPSVRTVSFCSPSSERSLYSQPHQAKVSRPDTRREKLINDNSCLGVSKTNSNNITLQKTALHKLKLTPPASGWSADRINIRRYLTDPNVRSFEGLFIKCEKRSV